MRKFEGRGLPDEDRPIFFLLERAAKKAAKEFGLRLGKMEPKRNPSPGKSLGYCWFASGKISIEFREYYSDHYLNEWRRPGEPKKAAHWGPRHALRDLIETVAHELAHLQFPYHGHDHKGFTDDIEVFLLEIPFVRKAVEEEEAANALRREVREMKELMCTYPF